MINVLMFNQLMNKERSEILESGTKPLVFYYPKNGSPVDESGLFRFKIKTEPSVCLVGKTVVSHEMDDFLEDEEILPEKIGFKGPGKFDGEKLVEVGGRLCYDSFKNPRPGGNEAYIKHLLEVGHGSVLEHAVFTFIITGVDRSFSHELVRHRIGSYSQRSQRFVYEEECSFIVPTETLKGRSLFDRWIHQMNVSYRGYLVQADELESSSSFHHIKNKMLRKKAILNEARSLLPEATETKIMCTWNARSLRNIIELRGSEQAAEPIRRVAVALCRKLASECPSIFQDYREESSEVGPVIKTEYRRV